MTTEHWWKDSAGENRSTRSKPISVPLRTPKIPEGLTWDWIWASAMRPTNAWSMIRSSPNTSRINKSRIMRWVRLKAPTRVNRIEYKVLVGKLERANLCVCVCVYFKTSISKTIQCLRWMNDGAVVERYGQGKAEETCSPIKPYSNTTLSITNPT
jgi:hypothetical protein